MVYLVGAGPGDVGLLTLRGAELLGRADVVVYDALVNAELLRLAPETAEVIFQVMKLKGVKLHRAGGKVGWKGDVTSNFIATETLTAWGWKPRRSSREAVFEAASRLALERGRT